MGHFSQALGEKYLTILQIRSSVILQIRSLSITSLQYNVLMVREPLFFLYET